MKEYTVTVKERTGSEFKIDSCNGTIRILRNEILPESANVNIEFHTGDIKSQWNFNLYKI